MSTEFFTRALELAHGLDPNVPPTERLNAERYLMALEASPEGLQLALHILDHEPIQDLRCFWAFNTILHQLPTLTLAEELYAVLFRFVYRYTPPAPPAAGNFLLLNKHAQVMAEGVRYFYPARWGGFFDDLLDLLARGAAHPTSSDAITTYFLRVCEGVEEGVERSREGIDRGSPSPAREMAVKDAMRGSGVVGRLVEAWYRILMDPHPRAPAISRRCLEVVRAYVEWIDLALVMTPGWMELLDYLVTLPALRIPAAECVLALVEKKQLPGAKMQSLRALNVVEAIPRLAARLAMPPVHEEEKGFVVVVCRLAAAVAEQFLGLWETCSAIASSGGGGGEERGGGYAAENESPSSPASPRVVVGADGVVVRDVAFEVTPHLLESLADGLHAVLAQLLRLLPIPLFEAREALLPCVQAAVKSAGLREAAVAPLLRALFDGSVGRPLPCQADEELGAHALDGQRRVLHNLIRLVYRRNAGFVLRHLSELVQGVVDGRRGSRAGGGGEGLPFKAEFPYADGAIDFTRPKVVEAVLLYFFEIGSAVKLEACLRDPNDAITYLLAQLLTSDNVVLHHTSPEGQLIFFEVMDRYHVFFTYHPQYIPILLQRLLLLPCGVHNPDDRVRARICYLFVHLLQVLKPGLTAYAVDILHALQSLLTGGPGDACHHRRDALRPGDRRDLWEAVGILLPIAMTPPEDPGEGAETPLGGGGGGGEEAALRDSRFHLAQALVGAALEHFRTVATVEEGEGGATGDPRGRGRGGGRGGEGSGVGSAAVSPLARGAAATPAISEGGHSPACVADAASYLTAIAKGLGGGAAASAPPASPAGSRERGGGSGGGFPARALARVSFASEGERNGGGGGGGGGAGLFARLFPPVVEHVQLLYSASPWRGSGVVREAVAQFLQQMIHLLPGEHLLGFCANYVGCSLDAMETVQELSKLLRLLDQLVNRMGARATPALVRMMPVVWNKVLSAGELTAASPVVNMGVVSESARETIDVYRSFFHLLFSIATWGCAPALLLLPLPYLDSMLAQLAYAITLPAEVELPKFALQALTRLSEELLARKDVEGLPLDPCESATFAENLLYFRACLLERVLPATLQALLRPGFNLRDAKNFILIGEAGQFFKALCGVREQDEGGSNDASSPTQFGGEANPLADAALQAIYSGLKTPCEAGNTPNGCSNHRPEAVDPIMAFCVTLRAKPRFNLALKNELRCLLAAAQQKAC